MAGGLLIRGMERVYRRLQGLYTAVPYRLSRDKRWAFPPAHLFISLTFRCNIRCEFCFEIDDITQKKLHDEEMNLAQWKEVIDRVPRRTLLTYVGGEIFMRSDFMELLAHSCARHRATICTNGIMLTPELLERLFSLVPRRPWKPGLMEIGVSLQGNEAVHDDVVRVKGSYARTTKGLSYLQEARQRRGRRLLPFTTLRCTMQPKNIEQLPHVWEVARRFGIDTLDLQVLQDYSSIRGGWEHFDEKAKLTSYDGLIDYERLREILYDLTSRKGKPIVCFTPADTPIEEIIKIYRRTADLKDYRCIMPWEMFAAHPDGSLTPCAQVVFPDQNIKDVTLRQANAGTLFRDFRHMIATHGIYPTCLGCCGCRYIGKAQPKPK